MAKFQYKTPLQMQSPEEFIQYTEFSGIEIPVLPYDQESTDILARPFVLASGHKIGNRFCVLPMEGWDGTADGRPTELTRRRWKNFGRSGAKLIWGGEAAAVRPDGRCNPNQLLMTSDTTGDIESLRRDLVKEHRERFGSNEDLLIGLQLTHSGRFSKSQDNSKFEPVIAYHHPFLDQLYHIDPALPVISDGELDDLTEAFVESAVQAGKAGFDFVDIKHCHGYLGHELLSAITRQGRYGGSLGNRTRFLHGIITGIQRDCPSMEIGVRISAFDYPPFRAKEPGGTGVCLYSHENGEYPYAFGADPQSPLEIRLDELFSLLEMLQELGVQLICMSAGSPYYNPHIQRPAMLPPVDGYFPPEDPLLGVARQISTAARIKARFPGIALIGSGYSYLQQIFPFAARAAVKNGGADFIGLGRMMFSYPEIFADILEGKELNRKKICRTCSRCTTAPRMGYVSGCYLLDPFYASRDESPFRS
jgi:2,4-dienoyl-CoA reductase-like NADH-dependent reductase (Old Yellow Enzyme family)